MPSTLNDSAPSTTQPRTDGLGRVLITVYLILALAATMRATFQIIAKFDEAPLAYSLSLASGIVYIVATIALIMRHGGWRVVAWVALVFEFVGVLVVGGLSFIAPEMFAHDSVWSYFGIGYLFIPLVLPVLGMVWLRRDGRKQRAAQTQLRQAGRGVDADPAVLGGVGASEQLPAWGQPAGSSQTADAEVTH